MGQTAGLGGCGKPRLHRVSIPGQAVNGILPNCEVYILFRLLGVRAQCDANTESSLPVCKCMCTTRRAQVTVSSSEHWPTSQEYLAQRELYYSQIFIVQGFVHV